MLHRRRRFTGGREAAREALRSADVNPPWLIEDMCEHPDMPAPRVLPAEYKPLETMYGIL